MAKVRGSNPRASNQAGASRHDSRLNNSKGKRLETSSPSSLPRSEWEETRCTICMEFPHNAVLLICSSHEKGCRPYMCDTSCRHSNCLDQFCKSSQGVESGGSPIDVSATRTYHDARSEGESGRFSQSSGSLRILEAGLVCPLCRGQVFGCVVKEAARRFLNLKIRSCSLESCEFTGNYAELRKHARHEHPSLKPSEADPKRQSDWERLEHQTDLEDTLSAYNFSFSPDTTEEDHFLDHFSDQYSSVQVEYYDWLDFNGVIFSSEAENVQSPVGTRREDFMDAVSAVSPFNDPVHEGGFSAPPFDMSSLLAMDLSFDEDGYPVIASSNGVAEPEPELSPIYFSLYGEALCPRDDYTSSGIARSENGGLRSTITRPSTRSGNRREDSPGIARSENGGLRSTRSSSRREETIRLSARSSSRREDSPGIARSENGSLRGTRSSRREETTWPSARLSNRREETIRPGRRARYVPYSSSRHSHS